MTSIDLMSTDIMSADPVAGILDLMAAALLVVAALLTLAAAIGLWRLPDPLSRLHAGTKPQILGLTLVVIAIALSLRDPVVLLLLVPVVVFQLLTRRSRPTWWGARATAITDCP